MYADISMGRSAVHGCFLYAAAPHFSFSLCLLSSLELALICSTGGGEVLCGDRNKSLD